MINEVKVLRYSSQDGNLVALVLTQTTGDCTYREHSSICIPAADVARLIQKLQELTK